MIVTNSTSPHENEYLAAVGGLHEQTPSPRTYAVGDEISGCTAGKFWSGRIEWIDGDRITLDVGGAWLAVYSGDVTH